jgi:hypothetical protein
MIYIGFNFSKILIERINDKKNGEKINTKLDISSMNKVDNTLNQNDSILSVKFSYSIEYSPDVAKIELDGNVLFTGSLEDVDKTIKSWENKEMDDDFKLSLFNIILKKSNIKALELEDELNLPPHMPLFSIKKDQLKKEE